MTRDTNVVCPEYFADPDHRACKGCAARSICAHPGFLPAELVLDPERDSETNLANNLAQAIGGVLLELPPEEGSGVVRKFEIR